MRRKKGRSMYSFHAMISNEATIILWASIVSLVFLGFSSCEDASEIIGHVRSTTPAMHAEVVFTNHSNDGIDNHAYQFANNQSSSSSTSRSWKQTFIRSGNELWDGIIDDCLRKPSFSCFQKNVYTYLDKTLKLEDVNVTDRIQFKKIDIDPSLMAQLESNDEADNEVTAEETREFKSGFSQNILPIR